MTDTATTKTEQKKWPIWIMAILAFITIGCWIITICAPSIFRKFMDIILWIFLFFSWLSWIINAFTNEQKYVWCLVTLWVLVMILWVLLIFSGSEFIWMLTIRCFAIWALLRWCTLIYYSITNREEQKFWRWILTLWILLIILFFVIAFSDKSDAKTVAWICIWISTVFDWLCLLFLSFRANDDPSLQDKILQQANQNEIAQWNSTETNQTVATSQPAVAIPNNNQAQQCSEVQPWDTQQPITAPVVQTPVEQPAPVVQTPVEQPAPIVQTPVEQPTPVVQTPVEQPTPVVQTPVEQPTTEAQAPVEQSAPVVQTPVEQPTTEAQQPNNGTPA